MKINFLRTTLAEESRAYGFTIAFWGSGALLIKTFGLPSVLEALLYGSGAVAGFAVLTLLVYQRPFQSIDYRKHEEVVFGMFHYIGALFPILITHLLTSLKPGAAFFLSGAAVSTFYNLGMALEEEIAEYVEKLN